MEMEISATEVHDSKTRLALLKNEKGRLGRLVAEARKSESVSDELMASMKAVSAEIKALQKTAKEQHPGSPLSRKWAPKHLLSPVAIASERVEGSVVIKNCLGSLQTEADAYVAGHPAGSLWHRPIISTFVETTFKHPTRYLGAITESGEFVGILPLVQLNSRLFGNFMVSMPYFNYGGILAENAKIAGELIKAADSWRQQEAGKHIELRSTQGTSLGLPRRANKVTFWLPLPSNVDDLWGSFKPKLRSQIRRGERAVTEFCVGGRELLKDFYKVFSTNMRDLGTPVYGRDFFENLLQSLPGQAWIVIVRIDGRAVGGAFLTGYRGRMEIPWASTLRRYGHTSINMSMYWRILEFAIQQGFKVFDFGRCTEQAGTYRFKRQWGAQEITLNWEYVLAEGESLPALNPDNPKFRLLIAAWRRLPVWLANLLGPRIVRMLP
ncbi:FemAB family XrtA/PEP-CTERM system-associated protein [Marinobacter apostichopi]|uniref:FemAB family XrtA/PEP-CTERM system-associated protein n=1 Tax=Marinobacter apostichopi TaxID=3035454 RepID=UPI002572F362|nr:FemAB family XrtA/PEP-CTERM system-associated protein [Marinobacter sp. LA51]